MEPKLSDFLTFTILSSPSFFDNIGGISSTLYDSTEIGLPHLITKELQRVIPPDIHKPYVIETPYGKICLRYKFAFFSADADKPLTREIESYLTTRIRSSWTIFDEVSLSLHSKNKRPKTILDPPCCLSDIPTVIPDTVSIDRSKSTYFCLDALKYMLMKQMMLPAIEDYDEILVDIANNLEKIREDYGLDPIHLTKYGFLNANYYSRPASIIRIALSYARANDINTVDKNLVNRVFEKYFKWNLNYVYEIWEDYFFKEPKIPLSLKAEYRDIIRVIRKYQSKGAYSVNVGTLISELREDPYIIERKVKEMANHGIIYKERPGFYRLLPTLE